MVLRIREARERLGISQKLLAEKLNIKQTTFNGYETGAHDPKSNILLEIAKYCDTTVDFLIGLSDNPEKPDSVNDALSLPERKHIETYRQLDVHGKELLNIVAQKELSRVMQTKTNHSSKVIPLYRYTHYDIPVSAGTGEPLDVSTAVMVDLEIEPPRGTSYILRIAGDSMEPKYHDGDFIYVHQTEYVDYGEIGIFTYQGSVYMKEYTRSGLKSLNPAYPMIKGDSDIRCLGKVLGVVDGNVEIVG